MRQVKNLANSENVNQVIFYKECLKAANCLKLCRYTAIGLVAKGSYMEPSHFVEFKKALTTRSTF